MNIRVRSERLLVRAAGRSTRHALVQLTAARAARSASRSQVHVSFVLDRSGSMGGRKIALARQAVTHALHLLDDRDRFSVVTFDDRVEVVVESTTASAEARRSAAACIADLEARGSTDLGSGWLRGCEQVAAHLQPGTGGRVLLLTDGHANVGLVDPDRLAEHAANLRARGVSTSTFGIGGDYDEELLGRIADAGAGRYYFIQHAGDIPDRIASEIGEALDVTARQACLAVDAPAGVGVELLNELPSAMDDGRLTVQLGDLVSGQELSLVLTLTFPTGSEGSLVEVGLQVSHDGGQRVDAGLQWTYAGHSANDAQPRDAEVDAEVAALQAARARARALAMNRRGDFEGAMRVLETTARRIEAVAGSNAVLRKLALDLRARMPDLARQMPALTMKAMHSETYQSLRSRDLTGKSVRH